MSIIQHLETHLGEIDKGWNDTNSEHTIKVVKFENQPFENVITYSTLGLSNFVLPMIEDRTSRQEFVFSAYKQFNNEYIASFLLTFAEHILSKNKALLRGEVIGPNAPIIWGTLLNSVYSAIPIVFENSFAVYDGTIPPTVFVWIIPLHEEEANYVRANGWVKFENLLETVDPDIWNLNRNSII